MTVRTTALIAIKKGISRYRKDGLVMSVFKEVSTESELVLIHYRPTRHHSSLLLLAAPCCSASNHLPSTTSSILFSHFFFFSSSNIFCLPFSRPPPPPFFFQFNPRCSSFLFPRSCSVVCPTQSFSLKPPPSREEKERKEKKDKGICFFFFADLKHRRQQRL